MAKKSTQIEHDDTDEVENVQIGTNGGEGEDPKAKAEADARAEAAADEKAYADAVANAGDDAKPETEAKKSEALNPSPGPTRLAISTEAEIARGAEIHARNQKAAKMRAAAEAQTKAREAQAEAERLAKEAAEN